MEESRAPDFWCCGKEKPVVLVALCESYPGVAPWCIYMSEKCNTLLTALQMLLVFGTSLCPGFLRVQDDSCSRSILWKTLY